MCVGMCTLGWGWDFVQENLQNLHKIDNENIILFAFGYFRTFEVTPLVNVMPHTLTLRETWHKFCRIQNQYHNKYYWWLPIPHFLLHTDCCNLFYGAVFAWIPAFPCQSVIECIQIGKQVLLILRHRKCTPHRINVSTQTEHKHNQNWTEQNRTEHNTTERQNIPLETTI